MKNPRSREIKDAAAQPFISLDDISIRLDERIVFAHTSWHIRTNQNWAILGPNGAGKTTLIRALCGELPVIGGEIIYHFLDEEAPEAIPKNRICHVTLEDQKALMAADELIYQARWNSAFDEEESTVGDFLSANSVYDINPHEVLEQPVDTPAFRRRRREVNALLEIEGLWRRRMIELSNGESRKVLIARALLREPQLLILDNPFSGLDPAYKIKLHAIISRLITAGQHLMLVTSRPDEIPACISHVLVVRNHRIALTGRRREVLAGLEKSGKKTMPRHMSRPYSKGQGDELLRLEEVTVAYGRKKILQHINWSVRKGEHWAVLGPNGSGKTTLLSLIMGDHPQAYANTIIRFGGSGAGESIWKKKKKIGWMAPELQIYYPADCRCLDVVCSGFFDSVGLYQRCSSARRTAALKWMRSLDLVGLARKYFGELSEGEQRMVLFCRALVKNPRLLILDEPCQGLDRAHRDRVLRTVDEVVRKSSATIVFVTHNPREIPAAVTHCLRLRAGGIASMGKLT
jgi:molybdate transport system ATP-binding protein